MDNLQVNNHATDICVLADQVKAMISTIEDVYFSWRADEDGKPVKFEISFVYGYERMQTLVAVTRALAFELSRKAETLLKESEKEG